MPRRYQHSLLLTCGRLYVHLISTFKGVYGSEVGRHQTGRGEFPDRACILVSISSFVYLPLSEKTTVRQVTYLHGHVVLLYLLLSYMYLVCRRSASCILLMFSSIRGEWSLIVLTLISSSSQDPAGTHDDIQKQNRVLLSDSVCLSQASERHACYGRDSRSLVAELFVKLPLIRPIDGSKMRRRKQLYGYQVDRCTPSLVDDGPRPVGIVLFLFELSDCC
ncbi:uncharacterized protein HD556DRAFT_393652 [Suillus plorans]|uniref:Uncharacterized protein n=1 Tax=Suillus plorans TaxID=116603 RepID=A0A9P7ARU1_9AGAM|nr:uncharacterized protein HD556DRAFT_393652 [Suillus plorans]KAG1795122.1 hypothetical protein HD556DRAFT_393652 [Suillus plorans]